MTLAEWIDSHKNNPDVELKLSKARTHPNIWLSDVAASLVNDWKRQSANSLNPVIDEQDVNKLYEAIGLDPQNPEHLHEFYDGIGRTHIYSNVQVTPFLVKKYINHNVGLKYEVHKWITESKQAPELIGDILSLPSGQHKANVLGRILENPNTKPEHAMAILRSFVGSGQPLHYMDVPVLEKIRHTVGDATVDAELAKTPATHPIHYMDDRQTDMSGRSAEEIAEHIRGRKALVDAYGGDKVFSSYFGYDPYINSTAISSPNFNVEHMRMWPEKNIPSYEALQEFKKNPKLSASVPHDELLPLIEKITGKNRHNLSSGARDIYAHMVDLTPTGGRIPHPFDKTHQNWFHDLSANPTFIANTDDVFDMLDKDKRYSMFGPERMTPELRQYFDKVKDAYDELGKGTVESRKNAYDMFVRANGEHNTGIPEEFGDEGMAALLPILSHYDPEHMRNWLDNSHKDPLKAIRSHLFDNRNVQFTNPDVFNGMKNRENLYDFVDSTRFPIRKLNAEAQGNIGEHFKTVIPTLTAEFEHFHEGQGTPYYAQKAADFDALDQYLEHAAKGVKHRVVQVKRGSGTLRALRDFLEQAKERGVRSINPRDLPKDKTWNSVYQTLVTKNRDGSTTESKTIDWNPLRGKDGNVSAETVQAHIDRMQPIGLHVTETAWDGSQRHNKKKSKVVVFGMTNDHIAKLKNAGLWEDFKKVSNDLPKGHPQHPFALGWVRYTVPDQTKKSNVFIDEVQNDIAKQLGGNTSITDGNKKKIMDIIYDGSHPSDLLHEAFHEYARSKKWHGRPFTIHSTESKRPISLSDQTGPVPVHYKKTYEEIVKQRFHVEPSTYGERPDETHTGIQGKPVWTGTIRKMEEELEKMALADVKGTAKKDHFDYSHLLPEHLKGAYTIRVIYSPATPEYDNKPRIIAQAITNKREFAGSVSGFISGNRTETHQGVKPAHQQKGLGSALLESVLAHAYNAHGVTGVHPAEHTEGATGTHRRVSSKHDLGFESSPTKADKYGQWYEHKGYILKNDDDSDWE